MAEEIMVGGDQTACWSGAPAAATAGRLGKEPSSRSTYCGPRGKKAFVQSLAGAVHPEVAVTAFPGVSHGHDQPACQQSAINSASICRRLREVVDAQFEQIRRRRRCGQSDAPLVRSFSE